MAKRDTEVLTCPGKLEEAPGEGLFELSHEDKQVITRDWDITQIPGLGKSVCENSARRREWRMLFTTRRCGDIKKENAIDRAL